MPLKADLERVRSSEPGEESVTVPIAWAAMAGEGGEREGLIVRGARWVVLKGITDDDSEELARSKAIASLTATIFLIFCCFWTVGGVLFTLVYDSPERLFLLPLVLGTTGLTGCMVLHYRKRQSLSFIQFTTLLPIITLSLVDGAINQWGNTIPWQMVFSILALQIAGPRGVVAHLAVAAACINATCVSIVGITSWRMFSYSFMEDEAWMVLLYRLGCLVPPILLTAFLSHCFAHGHRLGLAPSLTEREVRSALERDTYRHAVTHLASGMLPDGAAKLVTDRLLQVASDAAASALAPIGCPPGVSCSPPCSRYHGSMASLVPSIAFEAPPVARTHDFAGILFSDLVGFAELATGRGVGEVQALLTTLFNGIEALRNSAPGVERVKTVGDCYVSAVFPEGGADEGAAALGRLMEFGRQCHFHALKPPTPTATEPESQQHPPPLRLQSGLSCGRVSCGLVGSAKFAWDMWGEPIGVAAALEQAGLPGQIHMTQGAAGLLRETFPSKEGPGVSIRGRILPTSLHDPLSQNTTSSSSTETLSSC